MPRQPIGVDPACYILADHFLVEKVTVDAPTPVKVEADRKSLAEAIQTAVEDWFFCDERGIG